MGERLLATDETVLSFSQLVDPVHVTSMPAGCDTRPFWLHLTAIHAGRCNQNEGA